MRHFPWAREIWHFPWARTGMHRHATCVSRHASVPASAPGQPTAACVLPGSPRGLGPGLPPLPSLPGLPGGWAHGASSLQHYVWRRRRRYRGDPRGLLRGHSARSSHASMGVQKQRGALGGVNSTRVMQPSWHAPGGNVGAPSRPSPLLFPAVPHPSSIAGSAVRLQASPPFVSAQRISPLPAAACTGPGAAQLRLPRTQPDSGAMKLQVRARVLLKQKLGRGAICVARALPGPAAALVAPWGMHEPRQAVRRGPAPSQRAARAACGMAGGLPLAAPPPVPSRHLLASWRHSDAGGAATNPALPPCLPPSARPAGRRPLPPGPGHVRQRH